MAQAPDPRSAISWGLQFSRTNRVPIDVSYVFDDIPAFEAYLTSGPAYAGQIVAVLNDDPDPPDVYVVNREGAAPPYTYTYSMIQGGGAGSTDDGTW